ncbi:MULTISPECIES: SepM family pheromone-processing serine protease [unclassified Paenibacillus]|uniref:SepM family pheromone-processing serine protease n=1 Tax=unclassified Paenibacillus TaxID=185978 RepID=UPI000BA6B5BB|nr:SepM family pheromone-processing serine protease [Paenibacillus sp. 7541]PAK54559.1 peptidase S16 [Paenibacillus sp. 7541]
MNKTVKTSGLKVVLYLLVVGIMLYVVVYMPTPYLIYQPGSAQEVRPMISVEQGDPEEEGTFMMTTVSATYANIWLLMMSAFNPNAEVVQKAERMGDQSREEYTATQVYYMNSSQSAAMEAAYGEADIDYTIEPEYVFVLSIPDHAENKDFFRPGDKLLSVDGDPATDNERLMALLKGKKVGDRVQVELERKGKKVSGEVPLVAIQDSNTGAERPGLGVMIATMQKVEPESPEYIVHFADTNIGGPSAGLIFTLEIYNQLTQGDLTKGYLVAGTGTIDKDGNVGPIGGVKHKVVAADRRGADIFLVPSKNYDEAKQRADRIGTTMELVPVDRLQEAVDYLEGLPPKS